ncbi:MAG: hypothetical protein AMJ69_07035 [Gammaproteobacteria bacterium SG8_47]|nr:MAG: hypothetical protein AMJ69_07035 [Gammaproteobacteria bacterium SG8_47]
MRLFSSLYERVMRWSKHRHAPRYLFALSFAESSFFPIPPDVMLAPMSLGQRDRAWFFAMLTTVASVLGGVAGYFIGIFAFDLIQPWLEGTKYWQQYQQAAAWFDEWGIWIVFLAGFSPIPYKVFTITAGVIAMAFIPFVLASTVGRGARFFMVAALMVWGGEAMEAALRRYIDIIGWVVVAAVVVAYWVVNA